MGNYLLKGSWTNADFFACVKNFAQIVFIQAVIFDIKGWRVFSSCTYRIGTCKKVASFAVSINKVDNLKFARNRRRVLLFRIIFSGELKSFKKPSPRFIYRLIIGKVL